MSGAGEGLDPDTLVAIDAAAAVAGAILGSHVEELGHRLVAHGDSEFELFAQIGHRRAKIVAPLGGCSSKGRVGEVCVVAYTRPLFLAGNLAVEIGQLIKEGDRLCKIEKGSARISNATFSFSCGST